MSWAGVITTAGESLIASYTTGNAFAVKGIVTGSGYEGDPSAMRALSNVKTPEDTGIVESIKAVTSSGTTAGTQFGMKVGATSGSSYSLTEVGLIVTSGGADVMVAYFSNTTPTVIPTVENFPDFAYVLSGTLVINNGAEFEITVDPNAMVSQETFEETVGDLEESIAEKLVANQGSGNAGKFMTVDSSGNIVPADVQMQGATSSVDGKSGLVPAPGTSDVDRFLKGDGTWSFVPRTVYTQGEGISITDQGVVSLRSGVITAQTKGATANVTISGTDQTMKVPKITVDAYGRVTALAEYSLVVKNTTYSSLAAASGGTAVSLVTTGEKYNWNSKVSCTTASVKSALGTGSGTSKYFREDGTWVTPPNTTYAAGSTLSLSSGTFNLKSGIVTAGTYGPSANVTGNEGNTITIPQITVDTYGRVTSVAVRTYTSKNSTSYLPLSGGTVTGVTSFTNTTASSSTTTGAVKISGGLGVAKYIYGSKVYNAVWNDYAEYRKAETTEPGTCVTEHYSGIMKKTTKRCMPACRIISDTFGSCMGKTKEAQTPIGVAGRVLAKPFRAPCEYKIGDAVCSAPGGKVDVMKWWEKILYPDRIVGIVSEIPNYLSWKAGTEEDPEYISVNGRIWIYVR